MYRLTATDDIIRTADGATIPANPDNLDWQEYTAWLEAGNTALAAIPVDWRTPVLGRWKLLRKDMLDALMGISGREWRKGTSTGEALAAACDAAAETLLLVHKSQAALDAPDAPTLEAVLVGGWRAIAATQLAWLAEQGIDGKAVFDGVTK
jgi:hypothetical protein